MKKLACFVAATVLAGLAGSAYAQSKDDVKAAAKKLAEASGYSWKSSSSGQFSSPVEGKTEKDGYTHISLTARDNTIEALIKGDSGAIKTSDGWQSLSDLQNAEGRGRFLGRMVRGIRTPADQALEILEHLGDLTESDGAVSGDLTEDGVKALAPFGRRRGGDGPAINNARGSAKFWIKDGQLVKYEYTVQGSMRFRDEERDIDRTTTVEISDIGSTKVEVPEEAKSSL